MVSPQHISRRWLTRRLSKVPDGGFVNAHCIYTPELADLFRQEGIRIVCILRDPRDVAFSQMHYIKQLENHFAHEGYMALPSDSERLLVSIRGGELGGRKLQSLDERYRQFLRWERDGRSGRGRSGVGARSFRPSTRGRSRRSWARCWCGWVMRPVPTGSVRQR